MSLSISILIVVVNRFHVSSHEFIGDGLSSARSCSRDERVMKLDMMSWRLGLRILQVQKILHICLCARWI
jgi:hypothetical protein